MNRSHVITFQCYQKETFQERNDSKVMDKVKFFCHIKTDTQTDRQTHRYAGEKLYAHKLHYGGINRLLAMLKFFKSRSKVKVICSNFKVSLERSCHKEHTCQI